MRRYLKRITQSARGEIFNPLLWPFLFSTLVYGVGFALVLPFTGGLGGSSLYTAMVALHPIIPIIWGYTAIFTILGGATFLLFNIPPFGKVSGLIGFMVWTFAAFCYILSGDWLVLLAVTAPNMWFWFWQYLSLSLFRREDELDRKTMVRYDRGEYDDELHPKQGKIDREDNRGKDAQSGGSYDNPDDGTDTSRVL
jgi:hypothetical protein